MIKASIICLILLCSLATGQQQLSFGVANTVQSQLDAVLTALVNELRLYGTSFQDNTRLQRQIDFSYEVISILLRELSPYNTVVQGQGNSVSGTKDIVLGSYNNVQGGGSNWIFTNYYTGRISGDLVVNGYRIQMDKKHLTSTRPDLVVFPLTPQQSGNYSRYFNTNNNFGSNVQGGVISLFKLGNIAAQQVNSYGIQYQQNQFQQTQFQPSQSSQSFGGFQVVQQGGSNNLRSDNRNSGFVETTNSNLGGFTVSSGFTASSNSGFSGFTRV